MAEDSPKLMIFLICFWTLLAMFTILFADYLAGTDLNGLPISCFQPYEKCPNLAPTQEANLGTFYNDIMNSVFNFANQIPVINLFTPIGRMIFMVYPLNVHPIMSLLLSMISVLTGLAVYIELTRLIP